MANLLERFDTQGSSQGRRSPGGPGGPQGLQQRGGANLLDPQVQAERGFGAYYKQPRWQTGGQMGSTASGFNTAFMDTWFRQQDQSARRNENVYERRDFTGIVLRDAVTGQKTFGDIYEDGKRVGNVFKDYGTEQANQLLLPMMVDRKTQAKIFRQALHDPNALENEVQRQRNEANEQAKGFLTQQQFADRVDRKHREQKEGGVAEALTFGGGVGGAIAGGAAAGAVVGSIPGAVIGAVVGGVAGGIGAWLNQDQLMSVTSSTAVQMEMARERRNEALAFSTLLSGGGQVATQLISPFQNLTQGAYDWNWGKGSVGDGQARFYEQTSDGRRIAPGWVQALNLGATVLDFASMQTNLVSGGIYQGTMLSSAMGRIGGLTVGGGYKFNDGTGEFTYVYDSFAQGLGAWGEVGIDFAQIALFRGVGRGAKNAFKMSDPKNLAGKEVEVGGRKFLLDDAGRAIDAKGSGRLAWSSWLAPSEGVQALSTRAVAMRMTGKKGADTISANDLYQAAVSLSTGSRRFTSMVLNGFGEGVEEGVQEVFDAVSLAETPELRDVLTAASMGFAAGFGMTLGSLSQRKADYASPALRRAVDKGGLQAKLVQAFIPRTASQSQQMYSRYVAMQALRQGKLLDEDFDPSKVGLEFSQEQFEKLPHEQQVSLSKWSALPEAVMSNAAKTFEQQAALSSTLRFENVDLISDFYRAQVESNSKRLSPRLDSSLIIMQKDSSQTKNVDAEVSLQQLGRLYGSAAQGFAEQAAAHTEAGDADSAALAQASVEQALLIQTRANEADAQVQQLREALSQEGLSHSQRQQIYQQIRTRLQELNFSIQQMWDGLDDLSEDDSDLTRAARMRAATVILGRDPFQSGASLPAVRLRANMSLTMDNINNALMLSHAMLESINGDFDGDTMRSQAAAAFTRDQFMQLRAGTAMYGPDGMGLVSTRGFETAQYHLLRSALNTSADSPSQQIAEEMLIAVTEALDARYGPEFAPGAQQAEFQQVLENFRLNAASSEVENAGVALREELLVKFPSKMQEISRKNMSNELLEIDDIVIANLQRFQNKMQRLTAVTLKQVRDAQDSGNKLSEDELAQIDPGIFQILENNNINTEDFVLQGTRDPAQEIIFRNVNMVQDALLNAEASDVYRLFQSLHNGVMKSNSVEAKRISEEDKNTWFEQASQFYSALRGQSVAKVDSLGLTSFPMQATRDQLLSFSASSGVAEVGRLALSAQPVFFQGEFLGVGNLAQQLFARNVEALASEYTNPDEEMQKRLDRWRSWMDPSNGARGTYEILGLMEAHLLGGEGFNLLSPNETLKQFTDRLAAMDSPTRAANLRLLRSLQFYAPTSKHERTPQREELSRASIDQADSLTQYRLMVDLIAEVANTMRPYNAEDGLVGGFMGDAKYAGGKRSGMSLQASMEFRDAVGFIQDTITKQQKLDLTRANVEKFFQQNQDLLTSFLDSVGSYARPMVVTKDKAVANWIIEAFLLPPMEAEMVFFRHRLVESWEGLGHLNNDTDIDDLRDPWMVQMWKVRNDPTGVYSQAFTENLLTMKTVPEFVAWVNKNFLHAGELPLTAWSSDVEVVGATDMSQLAPPSSDTSVREALRRFKLKAKQARAEAASINENLAKDKAMAESLLPQLRAAMRKVGSKANPYGSLQEVLQYSDPKNNRTISPELRSFIHMWQIAIDQQTSAGPNTIVDAVNRFLLGVHGEMHGKATSSQEQQNIGMADLYRETYGFSSHFDRTLDRVFSVDSHQIASNPKGLLGQEPAITGESGLFFQGKRIGAEEVLEMFTDPNTWNMGRALLLPTALETDFAGEPSIHILGQGTLAETIKDSSESLVDILQNENGARSLELIPLLDSLVHRHTPEGSADQRALRTIANLVVARSSGADRILTESEQLSEITQVARDAMRTLKFIAQQRAAMSHIDPNTGEVTFLPAPTLNVLARNLQERRIERRWDRAFKSRGPVDVLRKIIDNVNEAEQRRFDEAEIALKARQADLMQEMAEASADGTLTDQMAARYEALIDEVDIELEERSNRLRRAKEQNESFVGQPVLKNIMLEFSLLEGSADKFGMTDSELKDWNLKVRTNLFTWLSNPRNTLQLQSRDNKAQAIIDSVIDAKRTKVEPHLLERLTNDDWVELSNAIASFEAERFTEPGGLPGQLIRIAPPGSQMFEYADEYFDSMLNNLLDPESPLVLTYAELLKKNGIADSSLDVDPSSLTDRAEQITKNLFESIGSWSPLMQEALNHNNNLFASAAAPQAVALYGDIPKKAVASAMANRSTWEEPVEESFSTMFLSGEQMQRASTITSEAVVSGAANVGPNVLIGQMIKVPAEDGSFAEVPASGIPLELINGRFARSVTATYKGSVLANSEGDTNLLDFDYFDAAFRPAQGDPGAGSGLSLIRANYLLAAALKAQASDPQFAVDLGDLDLMSASVEDLEAAGFDLSELQFTVEYLHPDSVPLTQKYAGNGFYQGNAFALPQDMAVGPIAQLFIYLNERGQQPAIDSTKGKNEAIFIKRLLESEKVLEIFDQGLANLQRTTNQVAQTVLREEFGPSIKLPPAAINAINAITKQRVLLRGFMNGDPVAMSLQEAINLQLRGQSLGFDSRPEIVRLSEDALRSSLGENNKYSLRGVTPDHTEFMPFDTEIFDPSREATARRVERVPQLLKTEPGNDTAFYSPALSEVLPNLRGMELIRPYSRGVRAKQMRDIADREASRMKSRNNVRSRRAREQQTDLIRKFSDTNAQLIQSNFTVNMVNTLDMRAVGVATTKSEAITAMTSGLKQRSQDKLSPSADKAFWVVDPTQTNLHEGVLSKDSIASVNDKGLYVAPEDVVIIPLSKFESYAQGDASKALRDVGSAVRAAASAGAFIHLDARGTGRDLLIDVGRYLRNSLDYTNIAGFTQSFEPTPFLKTSLLERNIQGASFKGRSVSSKNRLFMAVSSSAPSFESGAVALGPIESSHSESVNAVPTRYQANYSIPSREQDLKRVKTKVAELYASNMDYLFDLSDIKPRSKEAKQLTAAMKKLVDHWENISFEVPYQSMLSFFPKTLRIGDIIPLYNPSTDQLILHRYGHKLAEVGSQFRQNIVGGVKADKIAISSKEIDDNKTYYEGQITNITEGADRTTSFQVNTRIKNLAEKIHLVEDGLKIFQVRPSRKETKFFQGEVFPGRALNVLMSAEDVARMSASTISNFESGLMFMGGHFYAPLSKALVNTEWSSLSNTEKHAQQVLLDGTLEKFMRKGSPVPANIGRKLYTEGRFKEILALYGADTFMHDPRGSLEDRINKLIGMQAGSIDLNVNNTMEERLTLAVLAYLAIEGTSPKNTVSFPGIVRGDNFTEGWYSHGPDSLFARYLDSADVPTRRYLFQNVLFSQMADGVTLNLDWSVTKEGTMSGQPHMETFRIAMPKYAYKGEGAGAKEAAARRTQDSKQNFSLHNTNLEAMSMGAKHPTPELSPKTQKQLELLTRDENASVAGYWEKLQVHNKSPLVMRKLRTPYAREYMAQAKEKMLTTRAENIFYADTRPEDAARYNDERAIVAGMLGLTPFQHTMIDFWVRRHIFREAPANGETMEMSVDEALQGLSQVKENIKNNRLPTDGAAIPQMHLEELQVLFLQNKGENAWAPVYNEVRARDWDSWVDAALQGHPDDIIDPFVIRAYDGLRHTFLGQTAAPMLPVSTSSLIEANLATEGGLQEILSVDASIRDQLSDETLPENIPASVNSIVDRAMQSPEKAKRLNALQRRRRMNKARKAWKQAPAVEMTQEQLEQHGPMYVSNANNMSAIVDILVKFRVVSALYNPALFVSAYGETTYRKMLDSATNVLTSTGLGKGAEARVRMGDKMSDEVRQLWDDTFGKQRISREDLLTMQGAIRSLASSEQLLQALWSEGGFQNSSVEGMGWFRKGLTTLANKASYWQDPLFGMNQYQVASLYMETIVAAVIADPYSFKETPAQMAMSLASNGLYVKNNYPELHKTAVATFKNRRSIKPTIPSMATGWATRAMMTSSSYTRQIAGVALWAPLAFANFGSNVAITMTGMQGPMQAATLLLHGRSKPKGWVGLQKFIAGEKTMDGVPTSISDTFDLSAAIETLDLSRSFVQSGVSLTSLFLGAMMVGSLGLTGEDEEEKRRRRRARYSNNQYVYDPRDIANDFRNAEAVFLEGLPFGLGALFAVTTKNSESGYRSMANPHWIIKQFLSPIMGIQMFAETGDFRHVIWGFEDGLASFPLINTMMLGEVRRMRDEMLAQVAEQDALGNPDGMPQAFNTMALIVMAYENMLFESSFANQVYIAMDALDRDPYIKPLIEDGEIFLDKDGNPMPTDMLTEFVDEETGEVRKAYQKREGADLSTHILAENRLGVALLGSLLTGQWSLDSSFFRKNMAAKVRKIEMDEIEQEVAEGMLLSMFDSTGNEVLTESGARAVFNGIYRKTVNFNDASLAGVFIPYEMRERIQDRWIEELTIEGMEKYEMPQWEAKQRAWAVWKGSPETGGVGLGDIVWSDNIPYSKTLEYKQLNTTYIPGPDGQFWATGVQRGKLMNLLGISPLTPYHTETGSGQGVDDRLNTVDDVYNLNTGMRALLRRDSSEDALTKEKIAESMEKSFEKILNKNFDKLIDELRDGKNTWRNYGPRGYSRYGRGGFGRRSYGRSGYGSSGGGGGYSVGRVYTPPRSTTPYGTDARSPNVSNPHIRRASIRRERFTSQRGRLKQWQ